MIPGITLALAFLGAVLGIINTWHALDRSRVKLRVRPKHVIPVGGFNPDLTFCIEVTNLSAFAVTIEEAGVLFKGTDAKGLYTPPIVADGGPWPRRLEPRSAVTIYGQPPEALPQHALRCAFAKTACGVVRRGSSPAFKQLVREQAEQSVQQSPHESPL